MRPTDISLSNFPEKGRKKKAVNLQLFFGAKLRRNKGKLSRISTWKVIKRNKRIEIDRWDSFILAVGGKIRDFRKKNLLFDEETTSKLKVFMCAVLLESKLIQKPLILESGYFASTIILPNSFFVVFQDTA